MSLLHQSWPSKTINNPAKWTVPRMNPVLRKWVFNPINGLWEGVFFVVVAWAHIKKPFSVSILEGRSKRTSWINYESFTAALLGAGWELFSWNRNHYCDPRLQDCKHLRVWMVSRMGSQICARPNFAIIIKAKWMRDSGKILPASRFPRRNQVVFLQSNTGRKVG